MSYHYFDAHCDTISRCLKTGEPLLSNSGHIDMVRAGTFDRYAQFFALFHDAAKAPADGMWAQCRRLHDTFLREVSQNAERISHCCTAAEINAAVDGEKAAALLSIEGADLIECEIEKIHTVSDWGVRFLNPVWNRANPLAGTNAEEPERGLSPLGRDFIRELETCGIYADVSHLSDAGFWDLVRMANRPIVASHSNSRALCPHPRNLTDDQFCAIRDTGGVVGMNFYLHFVGDASMDSFLRHIEHFLDLDGEKTICMGGDFDGCEELAAGFRDVQDVPKIYQALKDRGYSDALLEDLFWNNLMRLL